MSDRRQVRDQRLARAVFFCMLFGLVGVLGYFTFPRSPEVPPYMPQVPVPPPAVQPPPPPPESPKAAEPPPQMPQIREPEPVELPAPESPRNEPPGGRPSEPARPRTTGWSILHSGDEERPGFGLYSYLLFGSRPRHGESEEARCLEAVLALFDFDSAEELARYLSKNEINVMYLPLVTSAETSLPPQEVIASYDYARAKSLLRVVDETFSDGPYIVSTEVPLTRLNSRPEHLILQDLSGLPPSVIRIWVREFAAQARQPRFWEKRDREQFILGIRTTIARLGDSVPSLDVALQAIVWRFGR